VATQIPPPAGSFGFSFLLRSTATIWAARRNSMILGVRMNDVRNDIIIEAKSASVSIVSPNWL
jgi:hypothetical protein